jgi:hypothetical protein
MQRRKLRGTKSAGVFLLALHKGFFGLQTAFYKVLLAASGAQRICAWSD